MRAKRRARRCIPMLDPNYKCCRQPSLLETIITLKFTASKLLLLLLLPLCLLLLNVRINLLRCQALCLCLCEKCCFVVFSVRLLSLNVSLAHTHKQFLSPTSNGSVGSMLYFSMKITI